MSRDLAGRLRARVGIARRAPTRDALAGADGGWLDMGAAWAALVPDGTGEIGAADALSAAPRWRVTLRAGVDVMLDDRLLWRGRRLRVRRRIDDPAEPDRFVVDAEEER